MLCGSIYARYEVKQEADIIPFAEGVSYEEVNHDTKISQDEINIDLINHLYAWLKGCVDLEI
jgi:hypothetical protein